MFEVGNYIQNIVPVVVDGQEIVPANTFGKILQINRCANGEIAVFGIDVIFDNGVDFPMSEKEIAKLVTTHQ